MVGDANVLKNASSSARVVSNGNSQKLSSSIDAAAIALGIERPDLA